jgi:cyclophilin family peptidyl-prolyl cis-trans isomerase
MKLVSVNILLIALGFIACNPKLSNGLRKKDLQKDVEVTTSKGIMIIRLSDSTPFHRDNFLSLAKKGFYDSMLFHRVIANFMIQAGEPASRKRKTPVDFGRSDSTYTIPAEFKQSLFHKKGAVAAAREPDDTNPKKMSDGTEFYIVEGEVKSNDDLNILETKYALKINSDQQAVYKSIGGTPFLDQHYTVFGEVIQGLPVIDSIANVPTSKSDDRPINDVMILKMKLISRSK